MGCPILQLYWVLTATTPKPKLKLKLNFLLNLFLKKLNFLKKLLKSSLPVKLRLVSIVDKYRTI